MVSTRNSRKRTRQSARNGDRTENQRTSREHQDQRVIIIAPVGQDASAMAAVLDGEGFKTHICESAQECSRQISAGAGALLLTQETLELLQVALLFDVLQAQPTWSELPLIILTSGGQSRLAESLDSAGIAAGTVTLLERPISTRTLVHSVQVALRSRLRQYQARDLVIELETLNQTLEQRVAKRAAEAFERAQQIRLLSVELSHAEEQERRRIAQILHDDLQQLLMAARMSFSVLRKTKDAANGDAIANEIGNLLEQAFQLTRSLSVELAPPILRESGLAAALEWLAIHTRKYYDVQVTAEADSAANPKAADVRDFLFRAVRELLLNAVKHAPGKPVHIAMESLPRANVRIIVADEGRGFEPAMLNGKKMGEKGFGLSNIRERILSFGGNFYVASAAGHGTRITLEAPCDFRTKRP